MSLIMTDPVAWIAERCDKEEAIVYLNRLRQIIDDWDTDLYRIEDLEDGTIMYDYDTTIAVNACINMGHDCKVSKCTIECDVEDIDELEALNWEYAGIYKA